MDSNVFKRITKRHSKTFYYATLFFPVSIRQDVFVLYAFLRTADDLADEQRDKKLLTEFKKEVYRSLSSDVLSEDIIINAFVCLYRKYSFKKSYLDSFFTALETDFNDPLRIKNTRELDNYMYGVAGVVGLMMATIMRLPHSLFPAAKEFGEVMQFINIVRDIKEDYHRNRVYLPQQDLEKFGLTDFTDYQGNIKAYEECIRFEIQKALMRLDRLSESLRRIPHPYRRAITISRDVYYSIAKKIYKEPAMIWKKRMHVTKIELFFIVVKNLV